MLKSFVVRPKSIVALLAGAAISAVALGGCAHKNAAAMHKHSSMPAYKSLYAQLGRRAGITKVVNAFVARVGADKRINKKFRGANLGHLKMELVNQIGQLSGGPEVYTGKDMKAAHRGMDITNAQWKAFMSDFSITLRQEKVSPDAGAELIGMLEPMKVDIVHK